MENKLFYIAMKEIEKLIVQRMASTYVPGVTLTFVKDDEVVYQRCFGTRNFNNNIPRKAPVTPKTSFEMGSCTKSFTSLAVLQLQEQGKLNVSDPVNKHLEWFELGSDDDPITIHHLLSHSSGIPALGAAAISISTSLGGIENVPLYPITTDRDYQYWINNAKKEIMFKPGEKYFYFNDGYNMLGRIISKVSAETYENYVKNHILKPIRMDRSFFMSEEPPTDGDVSVHYQVKDKKIIAAPRTVDTTNNPAGGLVCAGVDVVNYMNMMVNNGVFEGQTIFNPQSVKAQTSIHIKNDCVTGNPNGITGESGYGYGWAVSKGFFGHDLIQHSGGTGVCSTNIMLVPDLKIGVFGSSNTGVGFGDFFIAGVVALMGKNPEEDLPVAKKMKAQQLLIGDYQTYQGLSKITIKPTGTDLLVAETTNPPTKMALIPDENDPSGMTFHIFAGPGVKFVVKFAKDKNGRITVTLERSLFHKIK